MQRFSLVLLPVHEKRQGPSIMGSNYLCFAPDVATYDAMEWLVETHDDFVAARPEAAPSHVVRCVLS